MAEQMNEDGEIVDRARTEDVIAEALARQAAMRGKKGPPKIIPVTLQTPKVKQGRKNRRKIIK